MTIINKTQRRHFLKQFSLGSLVLATGKFPMDLLIDDPALTTITILHTNDIHSRIDPFPMDGGKLQGLGGAARRAGMISKIRKEKENVLLFDCGDIFQGTPYFNYFSGELEMKLMSEMNYSAGTMGNHDFDAGIDGFDKQLPLANFPFIVSNYNFDDTILNGKIEKYKIFEVDEVKIGVIGLGIKLDGLVPQSAYKETQYIDPITTGQQYASLLKNEMGCDYVICLSHLGYSYNKKYNRPDDVMLAENSQDIDLILGGHTHTFLKKPTTKVNLNGKPVIISQCGWAGTILGQINLQFEKNKKNTCLSCKNLTVK